MGPGRNGDDAAVLTKPGSLSTAQAFVGRERDLERLRVLLADATDGRGGLALLVGEPGIGKTRTARELASEATRTDALVLWGRGFEGEWRRPYGLWGEALGGYARAVGPDRLRAKLECLAPELARLIHGPWPEPLQAESEGLGAEGNDRFRLYDAVSQLLLTATDERPIVLVLDDLHWADRDSLQLLCYLGRLVADAGLLIVGTYRDSEVGRGHPLADTLAELGREANCEWILLRGLSEEDVARYLAAMAGQELTDVMVRRIHAVTEGNPFYVRELFRYLTADGSLDIASDDASDPGVPESVRHVVSRRVARLSVGAQELLRVASAFPRGFELGVLSALLPGPDDERLDQIDEALRVGLVRAVAGRPGLYRFAHAIVRHAVYDELSGGQRVRLHRRAGDVLETLHAVNPEPWLSELAHHFFRAAQGGDATKALDYAMRAARRSARLLAYGEAAEYFERALQLLELAGPVAEPAAGSPAQRQCELLLELGDAHWNAGDLPRARATFMRAAEAARALDGLDAGQLLARAALSVRGVVVIGPYDPALVRLLEEALHAVGDGDSAIRAKLLARLGQVLYFADARDRRIELSEQAAQMALRVGDKTALVHALVARQLAFSNPDDVEGRLTNATEIVQLAEDVGDHELAILGHCWRVTSLLELENLPAVDAAITRLSRQAEELGQPYCRWRVTLLLTVRRVMECRFAEAEQLAHQMLVIGRQVQDPAAEAFYGLQLFMLYREQGRVNDLAELEAIVRTSIDRYPTLPIMRCWLALLEVELGREAEARQELDGLASNDFRDLPYDVSWLPLVTWLAELCALLDDSGRAETLSALLQPHARRVAVLRNALTFLGSTSRSLGLLAATLGHWTEAARHFEDAVALHTRMGLPALLAHTQHEYGRALLAGGQREERRRAFELLDAARSTARDLGLVPLADKVQALLAAFDRTASAPHPAAWAAPASGRLRARTGGPPTTHAEHLLTRREQEVARLIAGGLTNRQIADELVIGERTAEMHVSNALGKLGLTSRAQVAVWAAQHGIV